MATRKKAQKTTQKVDVGALADIKFSNKSKKNAQKAAKHIGGKALVFALAFLLVGVAIGGGVWWGFCKNDCFMLLGQEEIVLTLEEKYSDDGVKIVAFGKDESKSVKVETNLQEDADGNFFSTEVGTFYIAYTSTCFKFGKLFKVQKVRLLTFVEASEGGE